MNDGEKKARGKRQEANPPLSPLERGEGKGKIKN